MPNAKTPELEQLRRAKLSAAQRGKKATEQARANMSAAHLLRDPERERIRRAKISAFWSGRNRGEEFRTKMVAEIRSRELGKGRGFPPGYKQSPEQIAKRVATRRANGTYSHTPETRALISEAQRGRRLSPEHKAKIGLASKRPKSPEVRQKLGEVQRRPEERAKRRLSQRTSPRVIAARVARLRRKGPNRIERAVRDALNAAGVEFVFQYPVASYVVDFYLPGKHLILECDEQYWHTLPHAFERDAKRDAEIRQLGYRLLRLPERRIKDDARALVEEMVN